MTEYEFQMEAWVCHLLGCALYPNILPRISKPQPNTIQRAQYTSMKKYALHDTRILNMGSGTFFNEGMLGSLGPENKDLTEEAESAVQCAES